MGSPEARILNRDQTRQFARLLLAVALAAVGFANSLAGPPDEQKRRGEREGAEFFESKIRPLLVARCYSCHSHQAKKLSGGLALDSKAGWMAGGDGGAVIVPGRSHESRLIKALGWDDDELRMPPKQKLSDAEIALFVSWVNRGAPASAAATALPSATPTPAHSDQAWEKIFQQRLNWWSLQPVGHPSPPTVIRTDWPRNEVDRFILASLETHGLPPAPSADRRTLARRLAFILTGLPPKPEKVEYFVQDRSPKAYENVVETLLASPHFGEHWARHWMDVVHYADTHGYEWDIPAKNAWIYRDYIVRAFNADLPYRQLILEHLAGDLLDSPRVNAKTGFNESLIGPMALRLGERRHGDNGEFDGITQEAMDNVIDTVSKTFLATTVACAHCHDHKLDAIAQRDYFAWDGVFLSSRWITRTIDAIDPNAAAIDRLRQLKAELRPVLAEMWLKSLDGAAPAIGSSLSASSKSQKDDRWSRLPQAQKTTVESPSHVFRELKHALEAGSDFALAWQKIAADYAAINKVRSANNHANLRLLADFGAGQVPNGWTIDGLGTRTGFAHSGDFVVMEEGPAVVRQTLPAGLYTHLYSPRLQGAVRSPMWSEGVGLMSLEVTGGGFASARAIFDHALFPEQATYLNRPFPEHILAHSRVTEETRNRRIYYELVTRGLNNNFPARVGLIVGKPQALADDRSWFGVTRVYAGGPWEDELTRFAGLFAEPAPKTPAEAGARVAAWLRRAVVRWRDDQADAEDVALINWLLENNLISNDVVDSKQLADLVGKYRALQSSIKPDVTVGSIADCHEGRDERIAIRGSYSDLGEPAPRGNIRFLAHRGLPITGDAGIGTTSGRLELARSFADPENPLTARVYVNRVWQALFGTGLVRTLDDFGHLGEKPSHPELLDYLARRFVDEGWSTKKLVRLLVMSATWQQSGEASAAALAKDPENRLWHHQPLRRLEAEEIRDAVLATSGRLDLSLGGPPIDPYRRSEDEMKRLFSGPIDGQGRRSLYIKMTLMEPPKFLAEFNQPLPKLTAGRRDVTNVPNQALTLLNDPFVTSQSLYWAQHVVKDRAMTIGVRLDSMLERAFGRVPTSEERQRFTAFVDRMATIRAVKPVDVLNSVAVWQDVAHSIFNLKEFIYIR